MHADFRPTLPGSCRGLSRREVLCRIGAGFGALGLASLFAATGFLMSMLEVLMLPLLLSFASVAAAGVVSSAVGMKSPGGIVPRTGWSQTMRASHPEIWPETRETMGW